MSTQTELTLASLNAFRCAVWGNDSIFKKNLPHQSRTMNSEYLDFGNHLGALQSFCSPVVGTEKLVVFQEYRNAMSEFNRQNTNYKRGACITGQPDIGKSMFIAYAVVERLRQQKPVAVQLALDERLDKYALFSADGVAFHACSDRYPLKAHPGIWALSDSNANVTIPTFAFTHTPGVRVFQTTYPAEERWKTWTKETGVNRYFMDLPSDEEIEDLARVLGHNAEKMKRFAVKWGRVPRTLVQLCQYTGHDKALQHEIVTDARMAVRNISSTLAATGQDRPYFPAASNIFFARPRKENNVVSRDRFVAVVPTPWIIETLGNAVLEVDVKTQIEFFNVMSLRPETRSAAAWLFEKVVQHFLIEGDKSMSIQWHEEGGERSEMFTPPPSKLCGNVDNLPHISPPFFWRPRANYAGIDGALVTEDRFLLVQITLDTGSTYTSPQGGVDAIWQSLSSKNLKNREWELLFIGSDEHRVRNVADKSAEILQYGDVMVATRGRRKDPGWRPYQRLRVGHVTIRPTEEIFKGLNQTNVDHAYIDDDPQMASTGAELGVSQGEGGDMDVLSGGD